MDTEYGWELECSWCSPQEAGQMAMMMIEIVKDGEDDKNNMSYLSLCIYHLYEQLSYESIIPFWQKKDRFTEA